MSSENKKGTEIKARIDFLNQKIEEILTPEFNVLNTKVVEYSKEIKELQNQCEHEYCDKGYCIYCYKGADSNE